MYNINAPNLPNQNVKSTINYAPAHKFGLGFLLKDSYLDISTFCNDYSQKRRFIKTINRLNYLQFIKFNFGRCSFLTLTISNDYINDKVQIRYALIRLEGFLRRNNIHFYIIAKEKGSNTDRLHYHLILLQAPYLEIEKVFKIWRIGHIKIQEAYNSQGGVFYIVYYLKKGLNLQFSREFFKRKILNNNVYYLVKFDKITKETFIDNPFNSPSISKKDYRIFKSRLTNSEIALNYWLQFKERHDDLFYYLRMASETFEKSF